MAQSAPTTDFGYAARLSDLRRTKLEQTAEKQRVIGAMDYDDWALILPPEEERELVQVVSPSGIPITDCLLKSFTIHSNHPSGGFFGPEAAGRNFRRLLESHPVYVDPSSSLAGAFMVNFTSYRRPHWNPDLSYEHLHAEQKLYALNHGVGAMQHFCQDLTIGLETGWDGLLGRILRYRVHAAEDRWSFYDGLEHVVLGLQDWITRTAQEADRLTADEPNDNVRWNLQEIAGINRRVAHEPPATFREACQWILWFQSAARMYNGSGSLGRIDLILLPYYTRDLEAGILDDEEAIFHLACLLIRDTAYMQLGGPDEGGNDGTNPLSYLVLEAAHRLRIPANIGVCVGDRVDPGLLERGLEILAEDRAGIPKFLGIEQTTAGFAANGYPLELARTRSYAGCHWSAVPGREYCISDCVKINFARVFEVALDETLRGEGVAPSITLLWRGFARHLECAVGATAEGIAFHLEHMHEVFPELVLDLLCHGTVEQGLDASHGGVKLYDIGIDGSALATVADSFAAIKQRIEEEQRLTWDDLRRLLAEDWAGTEGERMRLMMRSSRRFGSGGSAGDEYALRVSRLFTGLVLSAPAPRGVKLIPGIFSWAAAIELGKAVGATPNGRRAGQPISHGPNPDPGFTRNSAPTALASAVAAVQPGRGNTAPLQIDISPALAGGTGFLADLIRTHFRLGGTQINMNVIDRKKLLAAHADPSKYPDLVVRVTGFSAYFASLSPEFRRLVVDRHMGS